MERNFVVTIEVRTVYKIPVQAPCVARAEKIARKLDPEYIRRDGTFVSVDREVTKVDEVK